ncbi:antiviral reverse transcriptase Drt3b [Variovorax paradoxus]|uniref:Reverse transcriptase domain-containing protein n=1 Tax=Variovorax paradoxus TaxID=34073 RepID=A0A6I6HP25_VARPD|nr:antiviral reverse transcriptase Drt3b [Variovorax paradoxus]QGW84766.1 hypothetical protein GOQ09_25730 [Variovorax paradoxus]
MAKSNKKQWKYRPLLTETLPYEVPVIFFNDRFYYALARTCPDPEVSKALEKLFLPINRYTQPYNYSIRKDQLRTTELSIIHPLWQVEICETYASYEGSLLSYCAKSEYSLRKPIAIASVFAANRLTNGISAAKVGLVHAEVAADELDPSHITSYFVYGKYNLLSKFFESKEFIRLEKKFPLMRTLDISKCFYNIYTHSISWAIKGKQFSKENSNAFSFEGRLDKIMQCANYNETNGIVVGPEFSRIFAEIILQDVDSKIQRQLLKEDLYEGAHYSIRRYVDDYSVFAHSTEDLDKIERVISENLRAYKLYLNSKKNLTLARPFISSLSLARIELSEILDELRALTKDDAISSKASAVKIRSMLRNVRGVVKSHGVEFGYISGWIIAALIRVVTSAGLRAKSSTPDLVSDIWLDVVRPSLDLAFYVCALDFRVRTSYSLCQIIKAIFDARDHLKPGHFDQIQHLIAEELGSLVKSSAYIKTEGRQDYVELYNILICGTHFLKSAFTQNGPVRATLASLLNSEFSYFKYITLKFCFLGDQSSDAHLAELNKLARAFLISGPEHRQCSERFLLLCDLLSSPDIQNKEKRSIYEETVGGQMSAKAMDSLASLVGFVDWGAVNMEHLLRRKELRPVYAMA